MKQDKGRGAVLFDKRKYTKKCLALFNTNQFIKLYDDPTKVYKEKIQEALWKMKHKFTNQEYHKLYSTDSNARRFYSTGKVYKVPENGTLDDLPIRPIVSNIGTASYHLVKYLSHLLSPLSHSEFIVKSTKHIMS